MHTAGILRTLREVLSKTKRMPNSIIKHATNLFYHIKYSLHVVHPRRVVGLKKIKRWYALNPQKIGSTRCRDLSHRKTVYRSNNISILFKAKIIAAAQTPCDRLIHIHSIYLVFGTYTHAHPHKQSLYRRRAALPPCVRDRPIFTHLLCHSGPVLRKRFMHAILPPVPCGCGSSNTIR